MSYEISQTDISGIQLHESKTQSKVSLSREIGEAQVVQTIFGRAKVRIIRKDDAFHRVIWWTVVIGVVAVSAFVWQGWYAPQQTEPDPSVNQAPTVSAAMPETAPTPQTENIVAQAIPPTAAIEPVRAVPTDSNKSLISDKSALQLRATTTGAEKEAAKPVAAKLKPIGVAPKPVATQSRPIPDRAGQDMTQPKQVRVPASSVTPQPDTTGKPQLPPVGANNITVKTQTIVPPAAKPVPPRQPVAATTTVPAAKTVAPGSSPSAVPALAAPLVKDDVAPAVVDKQLAAPLNTQSK